MAITLDGTTGITTPSDTISGNLTFTGTGNRITGDFSNATFANRVAFQTSTTNGATTVLALPNGTGTTASWDAYNNSDPTNSSYFALSALSTEARLSSTIRGTGTFLPMTFYTNGSERMRIDTSGNVLIGSSTANAKLYSYATSGTTTTLGRFEAAIGSYTGTSLIAANTLIASSSFNLFSCITDSDGDAGGPVTQFLVRGDGNVGIGTSSPLAKLQTNSTDGTIAIFRTTSGANNSRLNIDISDSAATAGFAVGGASTFPALTFANGGSERMRIDSSGFVYMNTTSNWSGNAILNVVGANWVVSGYSTGTATNTGAFLSRVDNTNCRLMMFYYGATTNVGYITTNGTTTSYGSASDYRLKENIAPMTGALAKVALLKPVTYTWKSDGSDGQGFIAHELQEVVPNCVAGEKDAVDSDGKPQYQGVDTSFLVATLTAAIQELKAELDAIKAEVAALKGA